MSENGEKILITHYVNPHLFWYCRLCDLETCAKELYEIETVLKSQHKLKRVTKQHQYEYEAKVILEYLPMQKCIRAQVLQLVQPTAKQRGPAAQRYIVWAMDYGFPIETSAAYMKPLPCELSKSLLHIQRGGLAYLLPVKQSNNSMDDMMAYGVNWQDMACINFEIQIKIAKCLTFDVLFQTVVGQNFGLLYMSDGSTFSTAAAYLIAKSFATFSKRNFKQLCTKLQPANMISWLTNDGKSNTEANCAESFADARCRAIHDRVVAIASRKFMTDFADNLKTEEHEPETISFKISMGNGICKEQATVQKVAENSTQREYPVENSYTRFRRKIDNLANPAAATKTLDHIIKMYDNSKPLAACSFSQETSNFTALKPAQKPQKPSPEQPKKSLPKEHKLDQRKMFKLDQLLHKATTVPTSTPTPSSSADALDIPKATTTAPCTDSLKITFDDFIQQPKSETSSQTSSKSAKSATTIPSSKSSYKSFTSATEAGLQKLGYDDEIDSAERLTLDHYEEATFDEKRKSSSKAAQSVATISSSKSSLKSFSSALEAEQQKANNNDEIESTNSKMTFENYIQQQMSIKSTKSMPSSLSTKSSQKSFKSNTRALQHVVGTSDAALKQDTHQERSEYARPTSSSIKSLRPVQFSARHSEYANDRMLEQASSVKMETAKSKQCTALPAQKSVNNSSMSQSEVEAEFKKKLDDILKKYEVEEKLMKAVELRPPMLLKQQQQIRSKNSLVIAAKPQQLQNKTTKDIVINYCDSTLVAHSAVPLQRIAHDYEGYFSQNVYTALKQKKVEKLYAMQRYAWPHLMHDKGQQSLVVIDAAKTGRTWSYLPAICSLVYRTMQLTVVHGSGPIAIVLVAKARQAQTTTDMCARLMQDKDMKMETVVGAYEGGRTNSHVRVSLHNGCGILVATPTHLLQLLQQNQLEDMFDATRLAHIVIDDIDLIHALDAPACKSLIGQLLKLGTLKRGQLGAQLVVTSQYWDASYMSWFVRHAHTPLLLFGDFLEAAAYARVNLHIKIAASSEKLQHLLNFLAERASDARTVIFCTDEENILKLTTTLQDAGYACLAYLPSLDSDVQQRVNKWKNVHNKKILICLDNVAELNFQNAQYLVHYTLANSWTKFKLRFSTIAQNFDNLLQTNGKTAEGPSQSPHVLVLLDEQNDVELPHLVKFLTTHKQEVDPQILAVARHCQRKQEEVRISKGYAICPELACHGKCIAMETGCGYRHVLTTEDAVQEAQRLDIPCFGVISVQLLKVYTSGHFAVRLLKHQPQDGQNWRDLPQQTRYTRLAFQLNMHFANIINRQPHLSPVVHDVCVLKIGEQYQRVRILDVILDTQNAEKMVNCVDVINLDVNTDSFRRKAADLLACPPQFRESPPLAIDVRLTGIVPQNNERSWLPGATKLVEQELQQASNAKGEQIMCIVDFSLAHTVFVKNVIVLEHLPTLCTHTYKVNLKQLLVDNKFGRVDKDVVQKLHSWAGEVIQLEHAHESMTQLTAVENVPTNDSHDDDETANKSIDASLEQLEVVGTVAVAAPAAVVAPVAAATPTNSNAARHSETWSTLPLDSLVRIGIGHVKENGLWSGFLAINMSEESFGAFQQLQQRIAQHMSTVQPTCLTDLHQCKAGQNFILKYNDEFVRAKLLAVEATRFFRLLLLDHGFVVNLIPKRLRQELLYPITEEFVTALPYQTIFCKLAGVGLQPSAVHVKTRGKYLYAVAKRKCKSVLKSTQMQAYEILLYECTRSDELHNASLFNKRLIELGVASVDAHSSADLTASIADFLQTNEEEPDYNSIAQLEQSIKNIMSFEQDEQEHAKMFFQQMFGLNEVKPYKQPPAKAVKAKSSEVASKATNSTEPPTQTLAMLSSKCRQPQVRWHQTNNFIQLSIVAQEESKYAVMCDGARLFYSTLACENVEAFHLHLCGYVQKVMHEKRGLTVVIKLLKSNCGNWPSLLKPKPDGEKIYKLNWLKYNLDHAKTTSAELSDAQKTLLMQSHLDAGLNKDIDHNWSDDSDNDDDYITSSNNRYKWHYDELHDDGDDDVHEHTNEFPVC